MEETYTFSRALHMMRYGGKKMKPINCASPITKVYYEPTIKQDALMMEYADYKGYILLNEKEIMGSWVEVKE